MIKDWRSSIFPTWNITSSKPDRLRGNKSFFQNFTSTFILTSLGALIYQNWAYGLIVTICVF